MKLAYFRSEPSNFGDELNAYMWRRLLPDGFLDDDESELFVGIGSILGEMFPPHSRKFVFGAGVGGYIPPPDLGSGMWEIVFVRGPRTAAQLGLAPERAICDSAILLRDIPDLPPPEEAGIAFMPHFESLRRGNWAAVCRRAGLTLIDPTNPPEKILAQIRGARLVVTEAMHGAIVSDALRTPWVAVRPFHPSHHTKWYDWSEALELRLDWVRLWPSSLRELIISVTGRGGHRLQAIRWLDHWLLAPLDAAIARLAAWRLHRIARRARGQLSADEVLHRVAARARQSLSDFVARRMRERTGTAARIA
jgi:succinoglycan biosynthesis protein ExoV